ncbi:MAG: DUF3786 domain-containing protein [Desulfobacteraceae bacterium]|jgi:hypothetical protein
MALSVLDVYKRVLPKTNCGECGYPSCMAFASMVVSERLPLKTCPYVDAETLNWAQKELDEQYAAGKWTRKDMAADALVWARERAASMRIADLPERIGGRLIPGAGQETLELPYFRDTIRITADSVEKGNGEPLTRWEQVFIYNHLAQGGRREPTGTWKGLVELPNTVSKVKSMKRHVEEPLIQRFQGRAQELLEAGKALGGEDVTGQGSEVDVALQFQALPRIPVMLLFWDDDPEEGYGARVKLLFDETIVDHLDIESIMFLSERIRQLLCRDEEE